MLFVAELVPSVSIHHALAPFKCFSNDLHVRRFLKCFAVGAT